MDSYATMLEKAVVLNALKSEELFDVIAEMTDALTAAGLLDEAQRDEAKQAVVRREMSASTVMTDGIALPHGRTESVGELTCCIGLKPDGFNADAPDGQLTRVVILLLVPPSAGAGYTAFLATVCRTLMDEAKREAMLGAADREGVLAVLRS